MCQFSEGLFIANKSKEKMFANQIPYMFIQAQIMKNM
jgi:hypothetical protein